MPDPGGVQAPKSLAPMAGQVTSPADPEGVQAPKESGTYDRSGHQPSPTPEGSKLLRVWHLWPVRSPALADPGGVEHESKRNRYKLKHNRY